MKTTAIFLRTFIVLPLLFVFQACSGLRGAPPVRTKSSASLRAAPVINGQAIPMNACQGSSSPVLLDREYSNAAPLDFKDYGVVWATVKMRATSTNTTGVFAQRLQLVNAVNGVAAFYPGSSFSPQNPTSYVGSSGVSTIPAGQYSLQMALQDVQSVVSKTIRGGFYPLCGDSRVIAASRTELVSATSPELFLELDEPAYVFIAGEKTVTNVNQFLEISLSVVNDDTDMPINCPATGTLRWVYGHPSTPSVSGHCELQLPPGRYRISNIVTSDQPNIHGTQHLGFLAVRETAGEEE